MELVEGGDLKRRMREGLTVGTALEYLTIIADCLATAHTKHIAHRDIKSANVLFRRDGTLLYRFRHRCGWTTSPTDRRDALGSLHISARSRRGAPGRSCGYLQFGAMAYEC